MVPASPCSDTRTLDDNDPLVRTPSKLSEGAMPIQVFNAYVDVWLAIWSLQLTLALAVLPRDQPTPPSNVLEFRAPRTRAG